MYYMKPSGVGGKEVDLGMGEVTAGRVDCDAGVALGSVDDDAEDGAEV
jgi:hypothetical protein